MGNKPKNKMMGWVIVAVVILAIAVASMSFNLNGSDDKDSVENIILNGANAEFCANNPSLDADVRVRDSLSSTKAYINATVLVQNLDTGSIVEQSITGAGTSAFTTLTDLFDCNSVLGYDVYVKADGTINSNGVMKVTADMLDREPVEFTIDASQYTPLKVKAYDNVDKAKATVGSSNSTDYITTLTSSFKGSDGANFVGSNADALDVTFTIAPNTTSYAKGKGLLIGINTEDESNLADYDESLTQVWFDGVKLSEASGLSENELRAMNSYEHIYMLEGTIGMDADGNKVSQNTLRVYLEPEGDQTAKTFDPVIKIVALGDYESEKGDDVLVNTGFKDDSSRTELYSAQTMTIVVG